MTCWPNHKSLWERIGLLQCMSGSVHLQNIATTNGPWFSQLFCNLCRDSLQCDHFLLHPRGFLGFHGLISKRPIFQMSKCFPMIIKSVAFTFAELLENIIGFQPLKQQYILHNSVEDRVHTKPQQLIVRVQSHTFFFNFYNHNPSINFLDIFQIIFKVTKWNACLQDCF